MEQAHREKAPVPAEGWAVVVRGKLKAAVEEAAGEEVVDRAKERAKVAARGKDKVSHRISEFLSGKENDNAWWRQNRPHGNGTCDRTRSRLLRGIWGSWIRQCPRRTWISGGRRWSRRSRVA